MMNISYACKNRAVGHLQGCVLPTKRTHASSHSKDIPAASKRVLELVAAFRKLPNAADESNPVLSRLALDSVLMNDSIRADRFADDL